jgi:hypothetical protein
LERSFINIFNELFITLTCAKPADALIKNKKKKSASYLLS